MIKTIVTCAYAVYTVRNIIGIAHMGKEIWAKPRNKRIRRVRTNMRNGRVIELTENDYSIE